MRLCRASSATRYGVARVRNVAGSPKFATLVKEGRFEEAVRIARQQIENGANEQQLSNDELAKANGGVFLGFGLVYQYQQQLAAQQLMESESRLLQSQSDTAMGIINHVPA